ncbi:MAG: lipoprotein LpqH [Gordonia sp. (in: high G+C Gram-positive bacteria)]|uniref:lipoprotein LpqH n=1 Tax=Gordonia sp. (in: high G+C Gram-positive bacteria) TaxID=84139 RepID=UPI0039E656F0
MRRVQITALLLGALALVAACGSGEKKPVIGGEGTVIVDGKPLDLPKDRVSCETSDGQVSISIGAEKDTAGAGVVVTDGPKPELLTVGFSGVGGMTIGYAKDVGNGSGTVVKTGNRYTITGEATAINMAHPEQAGRKRFEITARCP